MEPSTQSPTPTFSERTPEKKPNLLKELLTFIFIAVVIVLPFRMYIAEPYLVSGTSMFPTFDTGHYLIVDKISYIFQNPKRFDVIVMIYPKDTSKDFIKRIIGLPGDHLVMKDNTVTITNTEYPQGIILDQSFVKKWCTKELANTNQCIATTDITLGEGEYFVMGDNRAGSYDSRYWGPLPKKDIVGHPLFRLFPLSNIGIYPGHI